MNFKNIRGLFTILFLMYGTVSAQEISLDNATNIGSMWHNQPDSIMVGSTYVFQVRINNNTIENLVGITNAFKIYSPDGAEWTTTVGDTISGFGMSQMDGGFYILTFGVTGSLVDTIGFGGFAISGDGLLAGFNDITYSITVGPIPSGVTHHGKTICIDSLSYPQGSWKWSIPEVSLFPSWDGPHCYTIVDEATDLDDEPDLTPHTFALSQNYPNPFNPTTTISFSLAERTDATLTIYNLSGQKVMQFSDRYNAGSTAIEWDASGVASGIYFYKLVAGDFTNTKKMLLLK